MKDKIFYGSVALACAAIAYYMIRDIWRKPDYTVTRRMIEEAEQKAIFGDDWEYDWDDDDDDLTGHSYCNENFT